MSIFDGPITLPAGFDAHVHLRDGDMAAAVTPTIRAGGNSAVFVMPNLIPPLTTVAAVLAYRARLQALAPDVTFLMSLYLHPSITAATIAEAKRAGVHGVKSYPAGVTTNSAAGVVDYDAFAPVFAAMQEHDLVLNLHGELPGGHGSDITVLNAEEAFLPTLHRLHAQYPRLRIVLEHCTTAAALAAVRACGPSVAATITAHHLLLTVDDWAGDAHSFCKPVAKLPSDRLALLRAAASGDPQFFFGSDSAPHPASAKTGGANRTEKTAAGCFTQPWTAQLVVDALAGAEAKGWLEPGTVTRTGLEGFLGGFGRRFYGIEAEAAGKGRVVLERSGERVPEVLTGPGGVEVVYFARGRETWSLRWVP